MNSRRNMVLISFFIGCSILFFLNFSRDVFKSSSFNRKRSCDTVKNFSYTDHQKYKTCLTWRRNDAFWSVQGLRHTAFKGLLNSSSIIIEVGGNIGLDTARFVELYDPFIISFEPLVEMSNSLIKKFEKNPKVEIQPYGLGNCARNLSIEPFSDQNTGTSVFRNVSATNSSELKQVQLLDIVSVVDHIRKTKTANGLIDMISINCEGCEFEIIPTMIAHNLTKYFRIIQFGSHMEILPDSSRIYCHIEQALERTHVTKYRYVMLWEAWVMKNQM